MDVDKLTHEVAALDGQIPNSITLVRKPRRRATPKFCRDKHKRRVPCGVDPATGAAVRASDAQVAFSKGSPISDRKPRTAHGRPCADDGRRSALHGPPEARRRAAANAHAPLAAAVFSVPADQVTDAQFQQVKKIVVFGLAAAFALLSALVSTIVHLQAKAPKGSGKVSGAVRAWLARRRKRLVVRRVVPSAARVEVKEHSSHRLPAGRSSERLRA